MCLACFMCLKEIIHGLKANKTSSEAQQNTFLLRPYVKTGLVLKLTNFILVYVKNCKKTTS